MRPSDATYEPFRIAIFGIMVIVFLVFTGFCIGVNLLSRSIQKCSIENTKEPTPTITCPNCGYEWDEAIETP